MSLDVHELQGYSDLLRAFEPRPVQNEKEAVAMSELIDALTDLPRLTEGQREFVGLLGGLLHEWEAEHYEPIEVSAQEIVLSLLEDNGLRQTNLVGPVFPSRSAVSDFVAGRRPLSYERVARLAEFFHVSPAVFYKSPMKPRSKAD
jgi:HTH-type transcriptional regulator/antitoxin HigA